MRLMSKGEYVIVPKGTKFTGLGKLGLRHKMNQNDWYPITHQSDVFSYANELPFLIATLDAFGISGVYI